MSYNEQYRGDNTHNSLYFNPYTENSKSIPSQYFYSIQDFQHKMHNPLTTSYCDSYNVTKNYFELKDFDENYQFNQYRFNQINFSQENHKQYLKPISFSVDE